MTRLDFGSDLTTMQRQEFLQECSPLQDMTILQILLVTQEAVDKSDLFFEEWDVLLAKKHSILVQIQIMFQIQDLFNRIFTTKSLSKCFNFASNSTDNDYNACLGGYELHCLC